MSFLLGPDSSRGSSSLFSTRNMKKRKKRKQVNHLMWFCEGNEQCGSPADVSPPRCYFWRLCDVFCFQRRPAWTSPAEQLCQTFSEESCWWHTCHKTHINQCCRTTLEIKYNKVKERASCTWTILPAAVTRTHLMLAGLSRCFLMRGRVRTTWLRSGISAILFMNFTWGSVRKQTLILMFNSLDNLFSVQKTTQEPHRREASANAKSLLRQMKCCTNFCLQLFNLKRMLIGLAIF